MTNKQKRSVKVFEKCIVNYCPRKQTTFSASLGLPKLCSFHADSAKFFEWIMVQQERDKIYSSGLWKA